MAFLLPCQRNLAVQNRNKKFVFSITALAIKNMRMKKNNKIIFLALTSRYAFPMTASAKPCDKKNKHSKYVFPIIDSLNFRGQKEGKEKEPQQISLF